MLSSNPDRYQVTRDSVQPNSTPDWSPGAEWIVFERLVPYNCMGSIHNRSQVFIAHPDGSNVTQISQGMYQAGFASFNPTGDLLAYDCRLECDGVGYATNICLYDLATGTQTQMISGVGYQTDIVNSPTWSPDGNYLIYSAKELI